MNYEQNKMCKHDTNIEGNDKPLPEYEGSRPPHQKEVLKFAPAIQNVMIAAIVKISEFCTTLHILNAIVHIIMDHFVRTLALSILPWLLTCLFFANHNGKTCSHWDYELGAEWNVQNYTTIEEDDKPLPKYEEI